MRWRIKRVDPVTQGGGRLPTRYNVTFLELDGAGTILGEYVVGCDSDTEDMVKAKIIEFFNLRESPRPIHPSHSLEGREYRE